MDDARLTNLLGPPLGWTHRAVPPKTDLAGRWCRLAPTMPEHTAAFWEAQRGTSELWAFLPAGPWPDLAAWHDVIHQRAADEQTRFFTIIGRNGDPCGQIALMRIDAANGSLEVGHTWLGVGAQRTPVQTEAVWLLAFDELGYRRLEWKANARNYRSCRAAERLGFRFEGIFRNHCVVRDRSRDTAWYAITDDDWPAISTAIQPWFSPGNVDAAGGQLRSLRAIRGG